jgi:hypothetical protein
MTLYLYLGMLFVYCWVNGLTAVGTVGKRAR